MATMDTLIQKGNQEVIKRSEEGLQDATKISDEITSVKESMADMPSGVDPDLLSMIANAENSARDEARNDMDDVIRSRIETARQTLDNVKSDIGTKIADNNAAKRKLDSIASRYGQSERSSASDALQENSDRGQEGLNTMERELQEKQSKIDQMRGAI